MPEQQYPHAAAVGQALPHLGKIIEAMGRAPDGTRCHFLLAVWTPDGVVQHLGNSDHEGSALVLESVAQMLRADVTPNGPVQ